VQPENLSLGLGSKRHTNCHRFNLFGERFEFRLLLLNLAAHIAQLLAHLKRVLDGVCALHDGQILRLFAPQISQAGIQINVLPSHVLSFHSLAIDSHSQLADFGTRFFETVCGHADRQKCALCILSVDYRFHQESTQALRNLANLFGSIRRIFRDNFHRRVSDQFAVGIGRWLGGRKGTSHHRAIWWCVARAASDHCDLAYLSLPRIQNLLIGGLLP